MRSEEEQNERQSRICASECDRRKRFFVCIAAVQCTIIFNYDTRIDGWQREKKIPRRRHEMHLSGLLVATPLRKAI